MSVSRLQEALASVVERLRSAPNDLWTKIRTARMEQSRDDFRRLTFWRGVVAEFIGSLFYVLMGCGASTNRDPAGGQVPIVQAALAFGLGYAGVVHGIRTVSGGHVNPSISLAALVTRKISVGRAILYVTAQFLGSILGAAILLGVTPSGHRDTLGCTLLAEDMSPEQGFCVELFATFLLVFGWFASFDPSRAKEGHTWAPFGVGMLLVAELMFAIPYSGGSFNTARSFGPAMVIGVWKNHWVFWFGPIVGGILGGVMYDVVFSGSASFKRVNKCLMMVNECENPQTEDDEPEDGTVTVTSLDLQQVAKQRRGRLIVRGSNQSNYSGYSNHSNHNDIRNARSISSTSSEEMAIEMQSVSEISSSRDLTSRDLTARDLSSRDLTSRETAPVSSRPSPPSPVPTLVSSRPSPPSPVPTLVSSRPSPPSPMPTPDFSIPLPPIPINSNPIPQGMGLLPCMIPLDDKGPDSPPIVPPPRTHRRQTPIVSNV